MVHSIFMPKFIRRLVFKRNLRIARQAKLDLDQTLYYRANVDARLWPEESEALDREVARLRSVLNTYLDKLNQPNMKEFHV